MIDILNKKEKLEIRKRIFLHLDGWALIPTIYALHKLEVLSQFQEKNKWKLSELNKISKTNEGYLNVALQILASQGYLNRKVDNELDEISLELTSSGAQALQLVTHYKTFYKLIQKFIIRPKNLISKAANIELLDEAWTKVKHFKNNENDKLRKRMSIHMEGILLGPLMVALGMNNKLQNLDKNFVLSSQKLDIPKKLFKWALTIFQELDFTE